MWRPGHGEETLHMYDDAFDLRDDHEMETIVPEDALPSQLNFQYLREDDLVTELSFVSFQDWLVEGKFNCDFAQAMLHTWMHDMRGSENDTLHDFFDQLFDEYKDTIVGDTPPSETLPFSVCSSFCSRAFFFECADRGRDRRRQNGRHRRTDCRRNRLGAGIYNCTARKRHR